ncbi:Highly reducing polyketide synthase pks5 [Pseudocercospora fuligena]|uniref:Highly reducing polyketide synthase pks5 n=1 Tax=Pseudocercospora fuligena TaxID=685502 RepID=A0A8H6VHB8_9PEZI|nr:Highly reducing polyketide synthase pks5 [Pseudocercospora fuligena]
MATPTPLAIVGMACRLPGSVKSTSELWELLEAGENAQSKIPKSRFNIHSWYHENGQRPGSVNAEGGYFLDLGDSYRHFDPHFFGISASEARTMDPQQRKLCETVYECFESAGITLEQMSGSETACFIGNFTMDWAYDQWKDIEYVRPHQTTGSGTTILSNRISHVFNLKGPSFTIDTACSSTMYALHYACGSLRNGDCSAALVGGTNLVFGLEQHIGSVALGALSPTSTCHTFDASADGYGRADAVGALLLKRLPDAIADGDPIRAIIRGTAVNANGRSSGISHPSTYQQEAVIRRAYANAKLPIDVTGYFECHGTGTPVGDPIEVDAIGRVFASYHSKDDPLCIGSVKTNLGHGEAASAIASIMKSVLVLENGLIPASVGIKTFNPLLDFRDGALAVCRTTTPWDVTGREYRRISINSFGIRLLVLMSFMSGYGGANAHAIIDNTHSFFDSLPLECCGYSLTGPGVYFNTAVSQAYLLPFSAHRPEVLLQMIDSTSKNGALAQMDDLAFTLSTRRSQFACKAFLVTQKEDSGTIIDTKSAPSTPHTGAIPSIVFAFTGQGAQWSQMGVRLAERFPIVRSTFEILDRALATSFIPPEWTILGSLRQSESRSRIGEAERSQTLCTALQIALVNLLTSWGVRAAGVIGHSSARATDKCITGEIAASYAAGLTTAEQAILIAYYRGVAVQTSHEPGAMMAVGMSLEKAEQILAGRDETDIVIACHNSPQSVTLSGTLEAINDVTRMLEGSGTFARKLETSSKAYHSPMMSAAAQFYLKLLQSSSRQGWSGSGSSESGYSLNNVKPQTMMLSSVTNEHLTDSIEPTYWVRNLLCRVRFAEALASSLDALPDVDHVLEIGPHSALASPIRETLKQRPGKITYLPTLVRKSNSVNDLLELGGKLYLKNYPLDLAAVNGFQRKSEAHQAIQLTVRDCRPLTSLQPYPWVYTDQEELWSESRLCTDIKFRTHARHDLLGSKLPGTPPVSPCWRNRLRVRDVPWLAEHRVAEEILFPAAGFVAVAVEAASQVLLAGKTSQSDIVLDRLLIHSALRLHESEETEIVTSASLLDSELHISIRSISRGDWTEHVTAVARCSTPAVRMISSVTKQHRGGRWGINADSHCRMWSAAMRRLGMDYGPSFTILSDISARPKTSEAFATVALQSTDEVMIGESKYPIHPTAVDAAFQLLVMGIYEGLPHAFTKAYIPTAIKNFQVESNPVHPPCKSASIHVKTTRMGQRRLFGHANILDDEERVLLKMDVELTALDSEMFGAENSFPQSPYNRLLWRPVFEHLTTAQLNDLLPYHHDQQTVKWHFERLEETCILILLNDHCRVPMDSRRSALPPHMQQYVSWVHSQGLVLAQSHAHRALTREAREHRISAIVEEMNGVIPELSLIVRLHHHLLDIVYGRVGALDVMVQDGLLSEVYEAGFSGLGAYDKLAGVVGLMSHQDPRMRILEVGAGSGGATKPALDALMGDSSFPKYAEYVFTDVSTAFLSRAQEKFKNYKKMSFSILDIEKDDHGFADHTFDLIIASNVIHATASIVETLSKCRRLLRPGGRIILIETTQIRLVTGLLVGQLPGYWLGVDDGRSAGPFISDEEWHKRLMSAGFSGADHILFDYEPPFNSTSVIVSRSLNSPDRLERKDSPMGTIPHVIASRLHELYHAQGIESRKLLLNDVVDDPALSTRVIILIELERAALSEMTRTVLVALQRLIQACTSAVWVTNAGTLRGKAPDKCLVTGLVKSMTIEEPSFRVATIDFDPDTLECTVLQAAQHVYDLEIKFSADPDTEEDHNFVEQGGVLHVSRNIIDERENLDFRRLSKPELQLDTCKSGKKAAFGRAGDLKTVYWEWVEPHTLAQDEVLVEARSFGIDEFVLAMLGDETGCRKHSVEVSGRIVAVGSAVQNLVRGDNVVCFGPQWLQTTFTVHHSCCQVLTDIIALGSGPSPQKKWWPAWWRRSAPQVPEPIVVAEAFRGQFKQLCLAWHVCHGLGIHIAKKSVLICLPGDTLGHALAQIMRLAGAFVTITHRNGREHYELHNLSDLTVYTEDALGEHTFDMVVCHSSHPTKTHALVRPGGDLILLGGPTCSRREAANQPACDVIDQGVAVRWIDLGSVWERDPVSVTRLVTHAKGLILQVLTDYRYLKAILGLATTGDLQPIRVLDYPLGEIHATAQAMASEQSYGSVSLVVADDSPVMIRRQPKPLQFTAGAAYLLVGCLGGLGRVITMWMISRGARNLIFLSRNGTKNPSAASLVKELLDLARYDYPDLRVQVILGDVGCANDVAKAVKSATVPIRGVIHAAMVLKESLFANMTVDVWEQVVRPKVQGARNLHEHTLGMDLDFFVLTSTILSVVGAATQSNYAAANAYLDHLARHRHHLGLQACSLSIGMVVGIGYVEEHEASEVALRRNGMYGIDMAEFLRNLELACRRKEMDKVIDEFDKCAVSNIITGMDPTRIARNSSKTIWQRDARLRHFLQALDDASETNKGTRDTTHADTDLPDSNLEKARELGLTALREEVTRLVVDRIAQFVMVSPNQIDPARTLSTYGMDSMIGAELRAWLRRSFKVDVPFMALLDQNLTFVGLADVVTAAMAT